MRKDAEKAAVQTLVEAGASQMEVAEVVGLAQPTVSRIIQISKFTNLNNPGTEKECDENGCPEDAEAR